MALALRAPPDLTHMVLVPAVLVRAVRVRARMRTVLVQAWADPVDLARVVRVRTVPAKATPCS